MSKLNYYKQYAKRCLLSGRTNSRAFDNCFEDGHGDEVVRFQMRQATEKQQLKFEFTDEALSNREPGYKFDRKHENQLRLRAAIERWALGTIGYVFSKTEPISDLNR